MPDTLPLHYHDQLESARLVTRKLIPSDSEIWLDFVRDKEALAFLPAFSQSTAEEQATFWIKRQMDRYAANQLGLQALIDKHSNTFIGQCGLLLQQVDGKTEVEVGYHILKQHRGHGYAPEAAKLFIDYAFKSGISTSVISVIDVNNTKSQRVAEKNKLQQEKRLAWNGLDVFIYRIYN